MIPQDLFSLIFFGLGLVEHGLYGARYCISFGISCGVGCKELRHMRLCGCGYYLQQIEHVTGYDCQSCLSVSRFFPDAYVKKSKRGACRQKAATVLHDRTAATYYIYYGLSSFGFNIVGYGAPHDA